MEKALRNIIKDKAVLSQRSMEDIVAEILEEKFLPANSYMKDIIMMNLYEHDGVGHTVSNIFQITGGGLNGKVKHSNFLPLLRFCEEQELFFVFTNEPLEESELELLKHYMKSLMKDLKKQELTSALKQLLDDDFLRFNLMNLYQFLRRNWDKLKHFSSTYRILYAMTSARKGWKSEAETRLKLIEILKEISEEWESPDMQG